MIKKTPNGEPARFLHEVALKCVSSECLRWPFAHNKSGYGIVRHNARSVLVNRLTCELAHGPAPSPRLEAAHRCGNRSCCNPMHLRWATHADNQADKLVHGTANAPRGEMHGRAKLTAADVVTIRQMLSHKTTVEIGKIFGVSNQTISAIHTRKNWAWL